MNRRNFFAAVVGGSVAPKVSVSPDPLLSFRKLAMMNRLMSKYGGPARASAALGMPLHKFVDRYLAIRNQPLTRVGRDGFINLGYAEAQKLLATALRGPK